MSNKLKRVLSTFDLIHKFNLKICCHASHAYPNTHISSENIISHSWKKRRIFHLERIWAISEVNYLGIIINKKNQISMKTRGFYFNKSF